MTRNIAATEGSAPADPGRDGPAASGRRGYRAAVVGAGFMGQVHTRAIRVAGGELVGVTASSPERSRQAAAELGARREFTDAEQLITDADVDVVHICTPNHLHAPLALMALEAGKHVVCEKPLATDGDTAAEMVAAARQHERVATVPFVYRFHPMVREARQRVHDGSIGRVLLAHGSYLQDWLSRPEDDNWRIDASLGGATRAFGDIGSHWCDLLEFVTGDRIARLSAQVATVNRRGDHDPGAVGTEDAAVVQFATAAGVIGSCVISQVSPGRKNRLMLEISGSEASLGFDQEDAERLWVGERERVGHLLRDPDTLGADAARLARVPAGHPQGYQDCFDHFVADTATAIGGDAPDGLPSFEDGLRAARLADAVLASAASQTWVEVAT